MTAFSTLELTVVLCSNLSREKTLEKGETSGLEKGGRPILRYGCMLVFLFKTHSRQTCEK